MTGFLIGFPYWPMIKLGAQAAVLVAVCLWGRSCGIAAGEAKVLRLQAEQAKADAAREAIAVRLQERAREREQESAQQMAEQAQRYEDASHEADRKHDRVVADLRSGALKLRKQWQGCVSSSAEAGASAGSVDDAADIRTADSGDLVRIGAACNATIIGLQAVVKADRGE